MFKAGIPRHANHSEKKSAEILFGCPERKRGPLKSLKKDAHKAKLLRMNAVRNRQQGNTD